MKLFSGLLMLILPIIILFTRYGTVYGQKAANKMEQGSFPVSADTKFFMMDLQNELNASKQTLKSFTPTKQFAEKYSLQKIKGKYHLSGFIQTDKRFSEKQLRRIQVFPGQPSGNIRTVMVPLSAFPAFLKQKGITYFELSKKVEVY